jgi:hypothetical protein
MTSYTYPVPYNKANYYRSMVVVVTKTCPNANSERHGSDDDDKNNIYSFIKAIPPSRPGPPRRAVECHGGIPHAVQVPHRHRPSHTKRKAIKPSSTRDDP